MGRRVWAAALVCALWLSGCGWMDGSYVSVTPHEVGLIQSGEGTAPEISDYSQLCGALISLVDSGSAEGLFSLAHYAGEEIMADMARAVEYVTGTYPIGAYAVEHIDYETGAALGTQALRVNITYRRTREEMESIRTVRQIIGAEEAIAEALDACQGKLVLQITGYRDTNFVAMVRQYAQQNPDRVMEIPTVSVKVVPRKGSTRVVELEFEYQTDRQTLRSMRQEVQPVFSSAALYVTGQAGERMKLSQLYTFLTERFEYTFETSVTPAHALLCRGVGDSQAFARVYEAMCRSIGLDVRTIRGTREGAEQWWNRVCVDGRWYHLDLLAPGGFQLLTDEQMDAYRWDPEEDPAP